MLIQLLLVAVQTTGFYVWALGMAFRMVAWNIDEGDKLFRQMQQIVIKFISQGLVGPLKNFENLSFKTVNDRKFDDHFFCAKTTLLSTNLSNVIRESYHITFHSAAFTTSLMHITGINAKSMLPAAKFFQKIQRLFIKSYSWCFLLYYGM